MSIKIRADQVRKGDKIRVGGQEVQVGVAYLASDSEVSVERPDPDAELLEVMAGAICAPCGYSVDWAKDLARAFLAAAREAGLLPEVTR